MSRLYLVVGIVVLVAVVVDVLWTTLWVDGGSGPLSARLASGVWRLVRIVSRDESRLLSLAGPLILALTLAMWIALIWIGWTLVFAGGTVALISTHTGDPADWTGRLYYVAYTMFTNGNGDYTPTSGRWELASSLTTASGMAFVTLGVSYVLTVIGAVSEKRSFAGSVTGLGGQSAAVVRRGWDRGEFDGFDRSLDSLSTQLSALADQHKSYPILHYYHSERGERSSAVAVAVLDDAMTLSRYGVADEAKPNRTQVHSVRSSVESYLETLEAAFIDPAEAVPPPPELDRLRSEGIPTVTDEEFARALDGLTERRRTLMGAVEADAWHWPPIDR